MISYPSLAQHHVRRQSAYNWSVLMREDGYGFGYVAQRSSENHTAFLEGWVLVSPDLTLSEACQLRDDLRSGEVIIEDLACRMDYNRQLRKQLSALAAGTHIPAQECIGKEFAYGQYLYRVVEHHADKQTFTLEMVNGLNMRIEKPETFVRHHCTPPAPRDIEPCRYERPLYPAFPRSSVIPAVIVQNEDIEHQPTDNQMIVALETAATLENPPTSESITERQAAPGLDPAYYLDQIFSFESGGTTFTVIVQAYNERRKQFRLYDIRPEARSGSFYRDAAFVYQHCQHAAAPVVREPLSQPTIDPFRFWNLVSLVDKRQILAQRVQETGVPTADPLLWCECCHQPVTIIGKQAWSAKMNRKDSVLVECRNEDCIAYRRTATTESHGQICDDVRREKGESA